MFRAAVAVLALWASAGASVALAQTGREPGVPAATLLARAESLEARIALEDSAARRAVHRQRLARPFRVGHLTVLLPSSAGDATGRRVAAGAAAYLDSLGAIPDSVIAGQVVVANAAAGVDSVLRAARMDERGLVMVDLPALPDSVADGFVAAAVITHAFWATLDADWRSWAPQDLGLGWTMARDGGAARQELLSGDTRVGERCLEGLAAECRQWLGVDRDTDVYETRYRPDELRRLIARLPGYEGPRGDAAACLAGLDAACAAFARQTRAIPPVPAGFSSRHSLMQSVRVLHGRAALRRALADSTGSVGGRLARASGVSEDSLVAEWRIWLLTAGGTSG